VISVPFLGRSVAETRSTLTPRLRCESVVPRRPASTPLHGWLDIVGSRRRGNGFFNQFAVAIFTVQEVSRLANGNTVICNWCAGGVKAEDWPKTVQVLEVTPEKKVVWALRSWADPDLGPSSSIQLLDEPGRAEDGDLQR
jgi:hypothetical protein